MEKPLKTACVGSKAALGGVSRNYQGKVNSISQVEGDSDMAPACWLCVGRSQCRNDGLYQHFSLRESCPFNRCPIARQFSFSSYVPAAFQGPAPVQELRACESQ